MILIYIVASIVFRMLLEKGLNYSELINIMFYNYPEIQKLDKYEQKFLLFITHSLVTLLSPVLFIHHYDDIFGK